MAKWASGNKDEEQRATRSAVLERWREVVSPTSGRVPWGRHLCIYEREASSGVASCSKSCPFDAASCLVQASYRPPRLFLSRRTSWNPATPNPAPM
jgi:hypothetical protein